MRIVVFGVTGKRGSALVRALLTDGHTVIGVARTLPVGAEDSDSLEWRRADIAIHELDGIVAGADAVVHLVGGTNAVATCRVLESAARQRIPAVVVA